MTGKRPGQVLCASGTDATRGHIEPDQALGAAHGVGEERGALVAHSIGAHEERLEATLATRSLHKVASQGGQAALGHSIRAQVQMAQRARGRIARAHSVQQRLDTFVHQATVDQVEHLNAAATRRRKQSRQLAHTSGSQRIALEPQADALRVALERLAQVSSADRADVIAFKMNISYLIF